MGRANIDEACTASAATSLLSIITIKTKQEIQIVLDGMSDSGFRMESGRLVPQGRGLTDASFSLSHFLTVEPRSVRRGCRLGNEPLSAIYFSALNLSCAVILDEYVLLLTCMRAGKSSGCFIDQRRSCPDARHLGRTLVDGIEPRAVDWSQALMDIPNVWERVRN